MNFFRNNRLVTVLLILVVLLGLGLLIFREVTSTSVVNPSEDRLRTPDEGVARAALYKQGDLYKAVEENEYVMDQIRLDLLTFARSTRPEFVDTETLVGFTFNEGFETQGATLVFTGYYYGVSDKIEIKLTPHGRGVYTLSITNLKDQTNIDEELRLNGKRNEFIVSLPVEKDFYSVRYQLPEDRVVVSFYQGYGTKDVDAVAKLVTDALGDTQSNDVVYVLNGKGAYSLDRIKDNLKNPIP